MVAAAAALFIPKVCLRRLLIFVNCSNFVAGDILGVGGSRLGGSENISNVDFEVMGWTRVLLEERMWLCGFKYPAVRRRVYVDGWRTIGNALLLSGSQ